MHSLEISDFLITIPSRIATRNANAIALFLESHKGVTKVLYPGLASHPQHELANRQQHGFGAMITFYCVGSREQSAIVLKAVSLNFYRADHLVVFECLTP
jgi:cystathionine beta-lyase/cystathionine gamma-synthase